MRSSSAHLAAWLTLGLALLVSPRLEAQPGTAADLLAAARVGDTTALQSALARGAAPDTADVEGATALMWAVHNGHQDAARMLVEAGAETVGLRGVIWMDETRRGYFGSVLGAAIGRGHFALVPFLVESAGTDVDAADWNPHAATRTGWTPLQWASVVGHVPTVAYLLERGADPERTPDGGATPLALALQAGHTDVADRLRGAGADPVAAYRSANRALLPGGVATDSLTTASDTMSTGEYSVFHVLTLAEGAPFEVAVTTTAFDPHLLVRAPSGILLQDDNWLGMTTEARVLVGPEAAEAGTWGVLVTSRVPGEVGTYRLSHRALDEEGYARQAARRDAVARADSLNRVVAAHEVAGRYAEAAVLTERELALRRQALGEGHPALALTLNNLAALHTRLGRYVEAEAAYERALRLRRESLGPDHPDVASSMSNLADLYHTLGRYDDAEALHRRALAVLEDALGEAHPDVARIQSSLAATYDAMGRYGEAEALHRRVLAFRERVLAPLHPDVARTLSSLAATLANQGRHAEALPLAERAAALRGQVLGEEHPDVAESLSTVAALYRGLGRYDEALPLAERAFALFDATLGRTHPTTAVALYRLAGLQVALGRHEAARESLRRAADAEHAFINDVLAYATEREQQQFVATLVPTDYALSSLLDPSAGEAAARDALEFLLHRKALRLDVMARQQGATLASDDEDVVRGHAVLQGLARQIASLTFAGPAEGDLKGYRERLRALRERHEAVADSLARQSGAILQARRSVRADVPALAAALPPGVPLVEFVRYHPYRFRAVGNDEAWGEAQYAAFVLMPAVAAPGVRLVRLGPAERVDSLVASFRAQIVRFDPARLGRAQQRRAEAQLTATSQALYAHLVAPLDLPDEGPVYVAPDGALHTLPFAVFVDSDGRSLADRYRISYLTSGRDLLRFGTAPAVAHDALVVFGGVDYDTVPETEPQPATSSEAPPTEAGSGNVERDPFVALPGTVEEAEALGALYPERARFFLGTAATEAKLFALHSPWRLHIATHGFFLSDQTAVSRLSGPAGGGGAAERPTGLGRFENPLLRSGLALAGANRLGDPGVPGATDGIATAYEISGLDLRGTDLVVLSACETGLGEIEDGEGVLGLRRAFELAGAETVVLSLWKVPDAATKELMVAFHSALEMGVGKAEALRTAARVVRADPRWSHPYWWGAFILAGNPE